MLIIGAHLKGDAPLRPFYTGLLFFVAAGSKAVLGMTLPLALLFIFVVRFFKREPGWKIEFQLGIYIALGMLALRFMIFTDLPLSLKYGTAQSLVYAVMSYKLAFLNEDMRNLLFLTYLSIKEAPLLFFNWPGVLFTLTFLTDRVFRKHLFKENMFWKIAFFVTFIVVCIIQDHFFDFQGTGTNVYYEWYSIFTVFLMGTLALDHVLKNKHLGLFAVFSISFAAGVVVFCQEWQKSEVTQFQLSPPKVYDQRETIDKHEWESMMWIRNNTPLKAVLLSDRREFTTAKDAQPSSMFFGLSGIAGRQIVVEGTDFIQVKLAPVVHERLKQVDEFLKSQDRKRQSELLKSFKADYFVQSRRFNEKDFSKIPELDLVFENDSVRIYKIDLPADKT
jgi:hypothetical protein